MDSIENIWRYESYTNYLPALLELYLPALSAIHRCRVSKLYERVREARSFTKLTQEALAGELGSPAAPSLNGKWPKAPRLR